MRQLPRLSLLALCLGSSFALAQPYKKLANQAAEYLEDAEQGARRAGGPCRQAVAASLDAATNHVYDLRRNRGDAQAVKLEVGSIAANASMAGCPVPVLEGVQRSLGALEEIRVAMWKEHHGRHNDWDDDQPQPAPAPAPFVELAGLTVQLNASYENEPAVRVAMPALRMTGMQGRPFYLGARFRSYDGRWTEWVTTQQWQVPSDPYVWRNAFQHFFRFSSLAEEDFSDGRFVAAVAVFDGNSGQQLASRELTFRVNQLPQLPQAPHIPVPEDRGPIVNRDCGTGNDVGCLMRRDGQYPMDAATFGGVLQSLRSNLSELLRAQLIQSVFQRNSATATQFGMLLDFFQNELLRLTVAQAGAPRLVDPQHALGYANKWNNPTLQAQYSQIILAQRPAGGPDRFPRDQPPGQYPPNQYPPMARDCGTGNDPDCGLSRGGRLPMDAQTFQGLLTALRTERNELVRAELLQRVLENDALTTAQLGPILDLFGNELNRLDAAKGAAAHLVNPQHALGLASKFRNSLLGQDFTQVLMQQR